MTNPSPQRPASMDALRRDILDRVAEYCRLAHRPAPFVPGTSKVSYGGRVFDERELQAATEAVLEFWLTEGAWVARLAESLSGYLGVDHAVLANSGSSANLLAMGALCSARLPQPLRPGDEVITPAVTFPTTVAPIVQMSLVPVFVDCQAGRYNLDVKLLEAALTRRTRAIFVPHTLGLPADMDEIMELAAARGLYVVEDACDALGSRYGGRYCGTIGDLGTLSFYPAHHITTGEGGAVVTRDGSLYRIVRSLQSWGRDCWCEPGSPAAGACGRRFDWSLEGMSEPYDHRYYYTEIGYNLKMTEVQAAIGVAQCDKLPAFVDARRRNFHILHEGLVRYAEHLILPEWSPKAAPAFFAYPVTVRGQAPFCRRDLVEHLNARHIETRYLMAGNILRQPAYRHIAHRIATPLRHTDAILSGGFFVGVYPGLGCAELEYVLQAFDDFMRGRGLC